MKNFAIILTLVAFIGCQPKNTDDLFCNQEICIDTISGRSMQISDAPLWSKKKALEHRLRAELESDGKDVEQLRYLIRFWNTAVEEENKFGVPFGISLAQGLLESSAGRSELASVYGNHFGIKCFKKACRDEFHTWLNLQKQVCKYQCNPNTHKCGKGSRFVNGCCVNFADDDNADRFKIYESAWYSWRDHSKFLDRKNYESCHKCRESDIECWAECLQRKGYATSLEYSAKLIYLVNKYDLQ